MNLEIEKIVKDDYMISQIERMKDREIYIYGAGSFGKETCYFLEDYHVNICGFIDQRAHEIKEYCSYPVYALSDFIANKRKENILILFAIVMDKKERETVIQHIKKEGFENVEEAQFFRSIQIRPDDINGLELKDYYLQKSVDIKQAFDLLKDTKSKNIFESNLRGHFLKDYTSCELYEDEMSQQYFPKDIEFKSGYSRFIDCGGFIGDTIEQLLTKKTNVEAIAVFEPDMHNFNLLSKSCVNYKQECYIFPCAVADETRFQHFSSARGSGTICEQGESTILSVSLDAALHGFSPTFIKMDIEGAEVKALKGAKEIIKKNIPDLAICVYHNINHLWDILLLLNSWNLGYEFYLRSYNAYTMETVLYATKEISE